LAKQATIDPVSVLQIIREVFPKSAERLDAVEAARETLEGGKGETETVRLSFGAPMNREIKAGFWSTPKSLPNGVTFYLPEGKTWHDANPSDIICPEGWVAHTLTRSPGMHGGYVTLILAKGDQMS
jgi:hypothetical protein